MKIINESEEKITKHVPGDVYHYEGDFYLVIQDDNTGHFSLANLKDGFIESRWYESLEELDKHNSIDDNCDVELIIKGIQ